MNIFFFCLALAASYGFLSALDALGLYSYFPYLLPVLILLGIAIKKLFISSSNILRLTPVLISNTWNKQDTQGKVNISIISIAIVILMLSAM